MIRHGYTLFWAPTTLEARKPLQLLIARILLRVTNLTGHDQPRAVITSVNAPVDVRNVLPLELAEYALRSFEGQGTVEVTRRLRGGVVTTRTNFVKYPRHLAPWPTSCSVVRSRCLTVRSCSRCAVAKCRSLSRPSLSDHAAGCVGSASRRWRQCSGSTTTWNRSRAIRPTIGLDRRPAPHRALDTGTFAGKADCMPGQESQTPTFPSSHRESSPALAGRMVVRLITTLRRYGGNSGKMHCVV